MIVAYILGAVAWTVFIIWASKHVFEFLDELSVILRKDPHEPTD